MNLFEKIFSRTIIKNNGYKTNCWVYNGSTSGAGNKPGRGYGRFWWDGKTRATHIMMWEHFNGKRKDNIELDHLCSCRLCCNPNYLEPVSRTENMKRMWRIRREIQSKS